ncbi:MAG: CaiB/BaiF CoA transferase family protein [Dehalococcoidia bacterium]
MLSPYRVLDLTDERGLLCGQLLADLGADVVAVEPPGGSTARRVGPFAGDLSDPERSLFWWAYSRNKRGITLDITTAPGRERLLNLVAGADFLIESFEPGHLDSLGLGYAALATVNPRLVMVSISAFGQSGPKAGWAATDLTALAASGTLLLTGDSDRPPVRVTVPQAFLHACAEGAVGALAALAARERDGVGQHVDVSAQSAATMATMSSILAYGWRDSEVVRVSGGVKLGELRLRFVFPCQDGFVNVSLLYGSVFAMFTRRLMEWICEEGFIDDATRDKDWWNYTGLLVSGAEPASEQERVTAAVEAFTRSHTKAELFAGALARGVLIVPVSSTADVVHSEQLTARGYWTAVERQEPATTVLYPGPFAKFSRTPLHYRRAAPRIGEHDQEVSSEWSVVSSARRTTTSTTHQSPITTHAPALAGVHVLDFTWAMAGAAGIRYLSDFGATVVRIESTTRVDVVRGMGPYLDKQPGPERSAIYANIVCGKLGVTLNLAKPQAQAVALKLAAWADIVTENFSPKAMRRWGLDYEALRAVNPNVIMLSTCLNGQTGPHAALAGFGTMGANIAGFGELAGWPDRPPSGPYAAYSDFVAPKFVAAAALAALEHRRRTGEGQFIDLSQAESAMHFLSPALLDYTVNGRVQTRNGNCSPEHAPHGVYPCAGDDRWVSIACATEAQWQALCAATGCAWEADGRFATFAARQQNRAALDAELGGWTGTKDVGTIEWSLQQVGVPVHRVSSSADAFADPQLAHRGHFVTVEHPLYGPLPVEAPRAILSATPGRVSAAGPLFGEHNEYVLREILCMSDDEIAELTLAGALE